MVQGFAEDEKSEGYHWTYDKFLKAVNGVCPGVLITDADPAVTSAVIAVFGEETEHIWCIWHIDCNLKKNLKSKMESIRPGRFRSKSTLNLSVYRKNSKTRITIDLRCVKDYTHTMSTHSWLTMSFALHSFTSVITEFELCFHILGKVFMRKWAACWKIPGHETFATCYSTLKEEYPEIKGYCHKQLDSHKEKWAVAYREQMFTAGVLSTQRAESMNRHVKTLVTSRGRLTLRTDRRRWRGRNRT
jgi:hypothetical protein